MVGDEEGVACSYPTRGEVFVKSVQINPVSGLSVEENTQINKLD